MKAYSQDLRNRVIKAYTEDNLKVKAIAKNFRICSKTVYEWVNKFKNTGKCLSLQGVDCGRKPRFTDKEAVLRFIDANPDADGIAIRDAVAPNLPMSTFYDSMARMEITYKKRAKIQRTQRVWTEAIYRANRYDWFRQANFYRWNRNKQ